MFKFLAGFLVGALFVTALDMVQLWHDVWASLP